MGGIGVLSAVGANIGDRWSRTPVRRVDCETQNNVDISAIIGACSRSRFLTISAKEELTMIYQVISGVAAAGREEEAVQ